MVIYALAINSNINLPCRKRKIGNSLDKLCHPTSVPYSAEQVLLNKQQIWCGAAYPDCYQKIFWHLCQCVLYEFCTCDPWPPCPILHGQSCRPLKFLNMSLTRSWVIRTLNTTISS